jgi:hypothetical protein
VDLHAIAIVAKMAEASQPQKQKNGAQRAPFPHLYYEGRLGLLDLAATHGRYTGQTRAEQRQGNGLRDNV